MRKLATVPLLQVILGIVAASLTIGAERPGPARPLARQHLSFQIASSTPAAAALVERWIDVDRPHREQVRAAAVWPEGSGAAPIVVVLHGSEGFLALIAAARRLPRARADRMALFGHSRGGTLALLVASTGNHVQAVVACAAQQSVWYTTTRRRTPIDVAPLTHVSNLSAPVLPHGLADETVMVQEARDYERAARGLGKVVEAHYYAGASHALPFQSSTQDDVIQRSAEFLRRHLEL